MNNVIKIINSLNCSLIFDMFPRLFITNDSLSTHISSMCKWFSHAQFTMDGGMILLVHCYYPVVKTVID